MFEEAGGLINFNGGAIVPEGYVCCLVLEQEVSKVHNFLCSIFFSWVSVSAGGVNGLRKWAQGSTDELLWFTVCEQLF